MNAAKLQSSRSRTDAALARYERATDRYHARMDDAPGDPRLPELKKRSEALELVMRECAAAEKFVRDESARKAMRP